jgi:hypothetical protein
MPPFDYSAPAELFLAKPMKGSRTKYRRFATAAEAISLRRWGFAQAASLRRFEPGERWFYDYRTEQFFTGPKLHAPHSHPLDQPVPGPAGAVPSNWQTLLHE